MGSWKLGMRGSSKEKQSVEEWGSFPPSRSLDRLGRGCEIFSGDEALEETEVQHKQKSSAWLKPCASLQ